MFLMYIYIVLKKRREAGAAGLLIGDRGCGQKRGGRERLVVRNKQAPAPREEAP